MQTTIEPVSASIRNVLEALGENPEREGLQKTPERVERSLRELTRGYHQCEEELLNEALYVVDSNDLVLVRDIPFFSLCEHHLLPFFGKAKVAYIPDGQVIGLSKIGRIVDMYACRLQIQEVLTQQIADALVRIIKPQGLFVQIEAEHLCFAMRGAQKRGSVMESQTLRGHIPPEVLTRIYGA